MFNFRKTFQKSFHRYGLYSANINLAYKWRFKGAGQFDPVCLRLRKRNEMKKFSKIWISNNFRISWPDVSIMANPSNERILRVSNLSSRISASHEWQSHKLLFIDLSVSPSCSFQQALRHRVFPQQNPLPLCLFSFYKTFRQADPTLRCKVSFFERNFVLRIDRKRATRKVAHFLSQLYSIRRYSRLTHVVARGGV